MKKIIFISITAIFLFASCERHERLRPSGQLITENYTFTGTITGVSVSGAAVLYVFEGEEDHIEVEVDDNILPFLNVRKQGETVNIYFDRVSFIGRQPTVTIYATIKNWKKVNLSGASMGYIDDGINCENLKIVLSGASTFEGHIEANSIDANLSGASRIDLTGRCKTLELNLSGASKANNYDMVCDNLNAVLSGASNAQLTVLKTLSATLSGASILRYDGDPTIIHSKITGASSLQKR
jgi:hypothetical protein